MEPHPRDHKIAILWSHRFRPSRSIKTFPLRVWTWKSITIHWSCNSVGSYNLVPSAGRCLLDGTLLSTSFPYLHLLCHETVLDIFAHVIFSSTGSSSHSIWSFHMSRVCDDRPLWVWFSIPAFLVRKQIHILMSLYPVFLVRQQMLTTTSLSFLLLRCFLQRQD